MAIILLILIYIAFISLGLPDSLIGVAWPAIRADFGLGLEYGGYISFIVTMGTVISSLLSGYFISKLKTGKVIAFSILLTSLALYGISKSNTFILMLVFALPLGFGAGSIDTAINNYVALHYKPHHMNWLHSFWGVGATAGPFIMSFYLRDSNWQKGFLTIAIIQFVFLILVSFSIPLWKKNEDNGHETDLAQKKVKIFKIKGVIYALLIFLVYCAIEFSVGIWGSSYLVINKGLVVADAARLITLYYLGITVGRFISGILSFFASNKQIIYGSIVVIFIGSIVLLLSKNTTMVWISFIIIGLGLAPIFPTMIHDTPRNFGKENSQHVIGYQIAFAYIGSAIFPATFGIIFSKVSINLFPLLIVVLAGLLLLFVSMLMIRVRKNKLEEH